MKIHSKIHPLTTHSHSSRHAKGRVWKELNQWSKHVIGVPFPILIALLCAVEYLISRMPTP